MTPTISVMIHLDSSKKNWISFLSRRSNIIAHFRLLLNPNISKLWLAALHVGETVHASCISMQFSARTKCIMAIIKANLIVHVEMF